MLNNRSEKDDEEEINDCKNYLASGKRPKMSQPQLAVHQFDNQKSNPMRSSTNNNNQKSSTNAASILIVRSMCSVKGAIA